MITVAFTVSCVRQKYLRATVDSWARARGARDARFIFCLEPPGTFPVTEFCDYVRWELSPNVQVQVSDKPLGCLENTRRAMEQAIGCSEEGFGVVAEEDVEVADDVLEYLEWARSSYYEDADVVAVCTHARASQVDSPNAVVKANWFCPLVWGTWHDRWERFIKPAWGPLEGSNNPEAWDTNLQRLLSATGRPAVFPVRSRSLHIGELSTLMGSVLGEYVYKASVSECYSPKYPPASFSEVPYPQGGLLWV